MEPLCEALKFDDEPLNLVTPRIAKRRSSFFNFTSQEKAEKNDQKEKYRRKLKNESEEWTIVLANAAAQVRE